MRPRDACWPAPINIPPRGGIHCSRNSRSFTSPFQQPSSHASGASGPASACVAVAAAAFSAGGGGAFAGAATGGAAGADDAGSAGCDWQAATMQATPAKKAQRIATTIEEVIIAYVRAG